MMASLEYIESFTTNKTFWSSRVRLPLLLLVMKLLHHTQNFNSVISIYSNFKKVQKNPIESKNVMKWNMSKNSSITFE